MQPCAGKLRQTSEGVPWPLTLCPGTQTDVQTWDTYTHTLSLSLSPATLCRYGRPLVKIDPKAEARLRKKIDLFVVPTVFVLYLLCSLDRAHIGNARIAGLDKDLGLAGNDYNVILTVFFIPYILLEIPMNAACKRIGPGWFLPAITLGFGTASLCTAFVQNRAQACGVRVLVGIFESGMMPGMSVVKTPPHPSSPYVAQRG